MRVCDGNPATDTQRATTTHCCRCCKLPVSLDTHTHKLTRPPQTLQPDWLSLWSLGPGDSNLWVLAGKYPQWPHMLRRLAGKNPLLFPFSWCKSITGSSSSSSSGNSVCIACKWMRQYLHFIPRARVCICMYAHTRTLIYLFGCFAIWMCLCVLVWAQASNWLWDQVFSCWFRLCWEFTRTWRGKREEKNK